MKTHFLLLACICFCTAAFSQSPFISSFSPSSGAAGTVVTITGTDLGSPTAVTIAGTAAIVVSGSSTSLTAMVMPGATTGSVSVATAAGTGTSSASFTLTSTPYPQGQMGRKLVANDYLDRPTQGYSTAISADGSTAIVGGYGDSADHGAAWVYVRSGNSWAQQGPKLVGVDINAPALSGGYQGWSVALSADGNTAIVGAPHGNGSVYVFVRTGTVWTQQGTALVGNDTLGRAQFGCSVALSADGNTALIGGSQDNNLVGAAWVFTRSGTTWAQQGPKLVGTGYQRNYPQQGGRVAISADGNTAISGGLYDNWNSLGSATGAVWVFTRSGSTWSQQGPKLVGSGTTARGAEQGSALAISADGNTLIESGWMDSTGAATWIFTRAGTTWAQQGPKISNTVAGSLSADGNTALLGSSTSQVLIYTRTAGSWTRSGSALGAGGGVGNSGLTGGISLTADGLYGIAGGPADSNSVGAAWIYSAACPANSTTQTRSICADSLPYSWAGLTFTQAGTQSYTYVHADGCDSVLFYQLTTYPLTHDTFTHTICRGDSFVYAGVARYAAGYYTQFLTSSHGCDSTVTLRLAYWPVTDDTLLQTICVGDSFTYAGVVYQTGGYYPRTFTSSHGCDSTHTIHVAFWRATGRDTVSSAICAGDSSLFEGTWYSAPGYYYRHFTVVHGCDSVRTLHLTVWPAIPHDTIDHTICAGGSFSFGGSTYSSGGYYTHRFASSHSCDSTVTLHLSVAAMLTSTISQSICTGSSYSFGGHLLSTAGTYRDTLTAAAGCDSIVTLTLSVAAPVATSHYALLCSGSTYSFGGHTLTVAGIYHDTLSTTTGCDSITTLYLSAADTLHPVISLQPSATSPHHWYIINHIPDSTFTYSWSWGDGSPLSTGPAPSHTYDSAGYYTICLTITDTSGCQASYCDSNAHLYKDAATSMVYVSVVSEIPTGIAVIGTGTIGVYPNPNTGTFTLATSGRTGDRYEVYDILGRPVQHGVISADHTAIDLGAQQSGIYTITIGSAQHTAARFTIVTK